MITNYRRYSKYADSVIMKYVNESPNNLAHAFRCAAFHLNRSAKGVEQRYYNHLCDRKPWESIPISKFNEPNKIVEENKKSKFTITFGKFCISISER